MMNEYEEISDMVDINSGAITTYSDKEFVEEQEQWIIDTCQTDDGNLVRQVQHCSPRLAELTENKIIEFSKPSNQDQLLRVAFWKELQDAADENRLIDEKKIYKGIATKGYWNRVVTDLEWKFTYILMPIKEYSMMNHLLLAKGQQAMLDILNADPYAGKTGKARKLDARVAKVQFEVFKHVTERSFGKAIERKQVHQTKDEEKPQEINDSVLEQEIKKMRKQLGEDTSSATNEYVVK